MKMIAASDSSILVVLGDIITPDISARVLNLFRTLQKQQDTRIRNLHPGYVSLLVDFDPLMLSHEEVFARIEEAAAAKAVSTVETSRLVEIPVCYGGDYGPDLEDVAAHAKLTPDAVVRLHASATYDVCFLGFTAGFSYLSGMPAGLSMPRLATPRRSVAAGSVGIAGTQTGIYPSETPGGWRLIGRTPVRMFDAERSESTLLLPGDQVRFVPINPAEFERQI